MSRGSIGTFVGAGIGFLLALPTGGLSAAVGAQIGAMIGGAVGSSFDTYPGRKVGEMSSPRAQEGEPIPLVFGSARVTGRLMSCGEPDIRTESEGGKGGPKVENETAYLSYSILVCESSELRDSTIGGILMVIENNKIVYDVRPNPAISAADSAKWKQNKVFYFGGEGQGVDPTEQMIHGAGNVPAYRGLCRMVVTDEDVTQHGGSIPTYEFVTSQCGVEEVPQAGVARYIGIGINPSGFHATTRGFDAGGLVVGTDDVNVGAITDTQIQALAIHGSKVYAIIKPTGVALHKMYSAERTDLTVWTFEADFTPADSTFHRQMESINGSLWLTYGTGGVTEYDGATTFTTTVMPGTGGTVGSLDIGGIAGSGANIFCCNSYATIWRSSDGGASFSEIADLFWRFSPDRFYTQSAIAHSGSRLIVSGWSDGGPVAVYSDDNGATWSDSTFSHAPNVTPYELKWCGGSRWVIACNGADAGVSYYFASEDNGATFNKITMPQNIFASGRNGMVASDSISGEVIVAGVVGGVNYMFMSADLISWETLDLSDTASTAIYELYPAGASIPYTPPEGAEELPDSPGHYVDPITGEVTGPTTVIEDTCPPITLQEIIDKLDARAGIPTANSITDELADIEVPGYAIDQFVTVAEAKEPLRQVWFFDCPEWDDAIRYRLRGQATDFTIDPDDLIEGEDATESGTRGQTVEYPKRLHVQYVDPVTGYKPMKQTAERISPDIRVKGELVTGANITLEADTAKQAADIGLKTAWTEREDSREFAIPVDYWPQAIAAHTFTLEGRRYRITELRLEAGAIYIKSVYDRISAYSSAATGTVGPAPVGQSNLRGPTVSAVMNLPVLRDADDRAGIYWAASGLLDTWQGAQLQLQRGAWENGPQATTSATMGALTASLPTASRYGMDSTSTLSVRLTPTSGALDSVTYDDLIAEANAAAILYADGTAEIVQFQTATETAPREYELTGLLRGRKDTAPGTHAVGAQFVLLNDAVRFAAIKPSDLGKTLTFRAVSLGTVADSNASQTLTLSTIESLREWSPYNVTVESDGAGGYCAAWIGRGRLGNSQVPSHSQWFAGYRVAFTVGDATYTVDTVEQSACVDADTMADEFGEAYGVPEVEVTARSRVATNDDDFNSPPASPDPNGPAPGSEVFAASGTFPNGYVGVPYILRNGDSGMVMTGGYWDATAYGEIAPGIGALAAAPISSNYRSIGIPHSAGTYTAAVEFDATSPVAGHYGTAVVTNSVTIAAKPTYSTVDMRLRINARDKLVATTPAWTTFELTVGSLYSYGFGSGKCRGEFTISGSTGPLTVGVNVDSGESTAGGQRVGIAAGFPNHGAAVVTTDGTYAVEYDCSTGNWDVTKVGTGSVGSGTVALPSGNLARFVCGSTRVSTVQVKANFGNEAWVGTPTATYVGVPMPSVDIPVSWDDRATQYHIMRSGDGFIGGAYATRPRGPGHTFGTLGKSAGKWRVGIVANGHVGLAVSTYDSADGNLGMPGTDDSIGYNGTTLRWCFGGVANSATVTIPDASWPYLVFALDMDDNELTFGFSDFDGNVTSLYTITGVPAGTWYPCESNSYAQHYLTYNPTGPIGFDNWTITV